MFHTKFGPFDGNSWESLCQLIFKKKYQSDDYQEMPASPGDFGVEGITLRTGWGFQCYCPDKHYERKELYDKQRDKITEDLAKLKTYQVDLTSRLGTTKLTCWVFVTPEIDKNALLAHARTKEAEVRGWKLPHLTDNFRVLLYDADSYLLEINEIRSAAGESLVFDDAIPALAILKGTQEDYEKNVLRKCQARLSQKSALSSYQNRVAVLHQRTLDEFLAADSYFRKIANSAPLIYVRLVRLINEFENHVIDKSTTWTGTPEELTNQMRDGLHRRITIELGPEFNETEASKVTRYMVARWLAVCELDYE
jgi:hypothetical protein